MRGFNKPDAGDGLQPRLIRDVQALFQSEIVSS
jgi:hypothetical protein